MDASQQLRPELQEKLNRLRDYFDQLGAVCVSFSGGVDSTMLAAVAHQQLGQRCFCVTESNPLYPARETAESQAFCAERGIRQIMITHKLGAVEGFAENPPERCYLCKSELFDRLRTTADAFALEQGFIEQGQRIACVEGSNVSDLGDWRPGSQAVKEKGILSPFLEVGLDKSEIREISQALGLPTWSKPSFACLASRFPYGQRITEELLGRVDAAEQLLLDAGFEQVRVRLHEGGTLARVEVAPDRLQDALRYLQEDGSAQLHELGFKHVSLDTDGYRTGSMND